ncbi:MAG: tetratricopeptide repeat protein, partial [Candidatus Methanoperedens sp.]|nr:tetratricopeptide repeat protein [Candidatus Methanoperedens sp.]
MQKAILLIAIVGLLLTGPGVTMAQDDTWTCDDGPNDVLNAAQAAYDAGELEQAYELVLQAEAVCGSGTTMNTARYIQATQLRSKIELMLFPTPTPGLAAVDAQALAQEGADLFNAGRYAEALEKFEEALTIFREAGNRVGEAIVLNNIGRVYFAQGQYSQALDSYQQALEIIREVDDRAGEGIVLSNIGGVYEVQGQYSQALDSYQQALEINREVGDRAGEGITLSNIGTVYYHQGQYAAALD